MKILSINSGSSSLKSSLFEGKKELKEIATIRFDGIGLKNCKFSLKTSTKNIGQKIPINSHEEALNLTLETLKKTQTIKQLKEIEAIGHRVVHGGEKYQDSIKIDTKVIKEIEELCTLAPLHNPANLEAIKICKKIMPKTPQVAVFDTSFYQPMPEKAFLYGIPYKYYQHNKIRRYGFHGTSHKIVVQETLKLTKNKKAKIISCHLGNGSSITASIAGKALDTSMGFTPLEGVIMGTRCGSIDPAIIFHFEQEMKMKTKDIKEMLYEESGLKGVSEISSDMRDIYAKYKEKNARAVLTIDLLAYQIAKYCGSYIAAMGGLDALVFTGGIGEKAFYVREKVCNYLEFMGLKLDKKRNENCEIEINEKKSKIKVYVLETHEEKQIALEVQKLIK